ncbi:GLPGLI family protein [Chryseobacterium sp. SC28]|uniref:GLPGLI family protein n=1 Tax=Chryseobacterium sp. SC28 TaxID=2268028 RepID=UPI000F64E6F4|nr:GLPGLI family protein [Chryseobacterium sp. SC28]RRQ46878.1 GLPGLI family protein [Chryseobacterium sp. SC28]
MKKKLTFIFSLFFIIISQAQVVDYDFINTENKLKYQLILDDHGNSEWKMIVNAKGDSINSYDYSKSLFKKNNEFYFLEKTLIRRVAVEDKPEFVWKIINNEKISILGYQCLTATTKFRGRNYKAYFAKNILVNSGPWKFIGLDGIILKIESDDGLYKFEATNILIEDKKFNNKNLDDFLRENTFLTWKEFEDFYINDTKDFIKQQKCNCSDDGKNILKITKIEKVYPELQESGIVY